MQGSEDQDQLRVCVSAMTPVPHPWLCQGALSGSHFSSPQAANLGDTLDSFLPISHPFPVRMEMVFSSFTLFYKLLLSVLI